MWGALPACPCPLRERGRCFSQAPDPHCFVSKTFKGALPGGHTQGNPLTAGAMQTELRALPGSGLTTCPPFFGTRLVPRAVPPAMPAASVIDEATAFGNGHRMRHCPGEVQKERIRFVLPNSSEKQARKAGRNGGGGSSGRGDWQKLVFQFIFKKSWRLQAVMREQFSWRKCSTLLLALSVVVIVPHITQKTTCRKAVFCHAAICY